MRKLSLVLGSAVVLHVGCGSSDTNFSGPPAGGNANAGTGTTGGSSSGGSATAGSSSGGSATAGSSSGGSSSGGSNAAGANQGGAAGAGGTVAATCPGTQTGCVIDWVGQYGTQLSASMDGVGTAAVFAGNDATRALTGDGTYLYVAGNNCVRQVEISSATVTTLAGQCGTPGYVNMAGSAARFGALDGMATDGTTVWVNDTPNFVIRAITIADGSVSTLSGSQGNNGFVSGTASAARFDHMLGMTLLGGMLYITEGADGVTNNNSVRRIDPSSGAVELIAGGNGTGAMNGAGDVAQFSRARKIGTDGTDLYVGDTENNRVRRIVLGGGAASTHTVSTFAGAGNGYADATGSSALFARLRGVTFDGTDLIVADSDNCVLRKGTLPGAQVTTIAGVQLTMCANHSEGLAAQAEFNKPMDIHYDATTGDLFIGEGNVIRRMYYQ